jgi:Tol biopolymer transport system component
MRRFVGVLLACVLLAGCGGGNGGGSLDGKIAFMSDRDGDYEIFVMNADGTGVTQLTDNNDGDGGSVWSPNGNKIAFHSNRDRDYEVFVMNADGSNVVSLGQQGYATSWGG